MNATVPKAHRHAASAYTMSSSRRRRPSKGVNPFAKSAATSAPLYPARASAFLTGDDDAAAAPEDEAQDDKTHATKPDDAAPDDVSHTTQADPLPYVQSSRLYSVLSSTGHPDRPSKRRMVDDDAPPPHAQTDNAIEFSSPVKEKKDSDFDWSIFTNRAQTASEPAGAQKMTRPKNRTDSRASRDGSALDDDTANMRAAL